MLRQSLNVAPSGVAMGLAAFAIAMPAYAQTVTPQRLALNTTERAALSTSSPAAEGAAFGCYSIEPKVGTALVATLSADRFAGQMRIARGALCPSNTALFSASAKQAGGTAVVKFTAVGGRYIIVVMGPASGGPYALRVGDAPVQLALVETADIIRGVDLPGGKIAPTPKQNYEVPSSSRRELMLRLVAKREAELARLAEKRRIAEEQRREEQRQIEEEEEEEAAYQAAQARRMPSGPSTLDILGMALGTINDSLADQNRQVQAEFQQLQRRAANQAQEQQRQRAQQAQQRAAAEASAAADRARQAATDDARRTALAQQATANARDLAARQQIAESRAAEQRQQQRDAATARSYVPRIPQNSTTDYSPTKVASEPPKRSYPPVPEAVSVCVSRGSARFACYGSISAMPSTVGPNAGPGYQTPEQWVAYVGNCDGRGSAIPINDGGVAWTCGYGVSGGLKDVARVTNTQIQGRGTFYCNPSEIYCRRRTPTDER